jgi:hypothetical protein
MAVKLPPLAPDHHFDAPRRKRLGDKQWQTCAWESAEEVEAYRRDVLHLPNWPLSYWDLLKFDISPRTKRVKDAQKTLQKALGKLTPEERAQLLGLLTGA